MVARRVGRCAVTLATKWAAPAARSRAQLGRTTRFWPPDGARTSYLSGARLPISHFVDAAVEAEYAFGSNDLLAGTTSGSTTCGRPVGPFPGIEIDNYHFFYGPTTFQELIASNALHAALVHAPRGNNDVAPTSAELAEGGIELWVNGVLIAWSRR